jgi:hypothetical protein
VTSVLDRKVPSRPVPVSRGLAVTSMIISSIPVMGCINYLHHMIKQNARHFSIDPDEYQNTQNQALWLRLKHSIWFLFRNL